jgi:hypothetical protein
MTIGQMRTSGACLVCGNRSFAEIYRATFDSALKHAVPFFLTDRTLAVHGRIVRCSVCPFAFTAPQIETAAYIRIYQRITQTPGHARQQAALVRFRRLKE